MLIHILNPNIRFTTESIKQFHSKPALAQRCISSFTQALLENMMLLTLFIMRGAEWLRTICKLNYALGSNYYFLLRLLFYMRIRL